MVLALDARFLLDFANLLIGKMAQTVTVPRRS
jgi:hypothetical protein